MVEVIPLLRHWQSHDSNGILGPKGEARERVRLVHLHGTATIMTLVLFKHAAHYTQCNTSQTQVLCRGRAMVLYINCSTLGRQIFNSVVCSVFCKLHFFYILTVCISVSSLPAGSAICMTPWKVLKSIIRSPASK